MAYTKNEWRPRQGTGKNRFLKSKETPTEVYLDNEPLSITDPGTPFSADRMNHIEDGIEEAHNLVAAESQTRQQGDNALAEAVLAESHERRQADTETLESAKAFTTEAQLATQTWLPAVNTKASLPQSGLNNKINYLCRVINDPSGQNKGVYQAIAGWDNAPVWTYFSDNADWVDDLELAEALKEHDEDGGAHPDIRAAISTETHAREQTDQYLQEQITMLSPDGENITTQLAALAEQVFGLIDRLYPVGTIYLAAVNRNPAEFIGGTWTGWGSGRVPVGVNTAQTEFNTAEKTGGAATHSLSEAQMPSHTHVQNSHAHSITCSTIENNNDKGAIDGSANTTVSIRNFSTASTTASNQYTGSGAAHNNLQPYITCYMWKRTA